MQTTQYTSLSPPQHKDQAFQVESASYFLCRSAWTAKFPTTDLWLYRPLFQNHNLALSLLTLCRAVSLLHRALALWIIPCPPNPPCQSIMSMRMFHTSVILEFSRETPRLDRSTVGPSSFGFKSRPQWSKGNATSQMTCLSPAIPLRTTYLLNSSGWSRLMSF